jgi:hypothetical protein
MTTTTLPMSGIGELWDVRGSSPVLLLSVRYHRSGETHGVMIDPGYASVQTADPDDDAKLRAVFDIDRLELRVDGSAQRCFFQKYDMMRGSGVLRLSGAPYSLAT